MDIQELKAALMAKGWTEDAYGHMKKELRVHRGDADVGLRLYRVKTQKMSVRLEYQYEIPAAQYSPAHKEWFRVDSCYLKDIKVRDDGVIFIGKKGIK